MQSASISYLSSSIHYVTAGKGDKIVFCFHGYGEQGSHFGFLSEAAGEEFTFIAIDLPFHGKTIWNEELTFTIKNLQEILEIIQRQPFFQQQSYQSVQILLGFSLGGRVALRLYESGPGSFQKIVLLAPDGLKMNRWYWLATQTWIGHRFFSFTLKYPRWFFGVLKLLNRLRLVNSSIFKFVNYYIGDKEVRRLLYQRWTTMRKITPDISRIKSFISEYKTTARLLYGRHDRIIVSTVGEKFRKDIEGSCSIQVIDCGHQVLHKKNATEIVAALSGK